MSYKLRHDREKFLSFDISAYDIETKMKHIDVDNNARAIDETGYVDMQSFKEETLKDQLLFQTEFSNYRNMYRNEEFKKLVGSNGYKACIFQLIWRA